MSQSTLLEELQREEPDVLPQEKPIKTSLLKKWIKEPFFHFLILGALIFVVGDYVKTHHLSERYEITLGNEELYRLASLWEKQYGAVPSETELKALADNYIREEILYREGVEMGLDQNDEVIRRRIAQKLEFLQQDLVIVKDPDEKELLAYYVANKAKYGLPEKISFTHIDFSPDKGGEEEALKRANAALALVTSEKRNRAPELGDRFAYLYDYSELSQANAVQQFGESELSQKIATLPVGQWAGPLKSGYGYHLVFVTGKAAPSTSPLAEIQEKVKADYIQALREQKNNEAFAKVFNRYTILK